MIIEETCQILYSRYNEQIENLTITDLRIGKNLSAVGLSDGSFGVAGTWDGAPMQGAPGYERDYGPFTPNQIRGRKVMELLESKKSSPIVDTLKIAVLNAISSTLLPSAPYTIVEKKDPIDLIDLSGQKNIVMVGAFQSYIRKIAPTKHKLIVLELNPDSLPAELQNHYVPAHDYQKVIPIADLLIITGLTLVNNTLDDLLKCIAPATQVVVTGPSANILPEVLFARNVSMIGATRITDGQLLLSTVAEGGAGYHLFKYCAQKICVMKEK